MKIGIISDTHLAGRGKNLPPSVFSVFSEVELILHCEDLECIGVLDTLELIAPVKAIRGYEDPREPGCRLVNKTRVITVQNTISDVIKIGIVHDIQWPYSPIYTSLNGDELNFSDSDISLLVKMFLEVLSI